MERCLWSIHEHLLWEQHVFVAGLRMRKCVIRMFEKDLCRLCPCAKTEAFLLGHFHISRISTFPGCMKDASWPDFSSLKNTNLQNKSLGGEIFVVCPRKSNMPATLTKRCLKLLLFSAHQSRENALNSTINPLRSFYFCL